MSSSIPYSAEQDDLFYPCKRGEFFPAGRPESEAALCAELARLAYCKQESSFAYDQDKIRSILRGIGLLPIFREPNRSKREGCPLLPGLSR